MSRFTSEVPGYDPALELSMRTDDEGGDVRSPCAPTWQNGQPLSQPDLVVLVHGYNNHRGEAEDAYLAFRERQHGLLGEWAGRLDPLLGDAFWPGDAKWPGPLDAVDFLFYPATIGRARQTADVLSDYLLGRRDVLNLYFVGHSMGCRVVLETIAALLAKQPDAQLRPPIRKVCLMAAAVPTTHVLPGGDLAAALQAAEHVQVLFSPDDLVLHYAFPIGQTAAGDGFFPTAVGRYGDVPLSPAHVERSWVPGADHGDYWGRRTNDASAESARCVHEFLGIGPQVQSLRAAPSPPRRPDAPQRPAPPARPLGHP